MALANFIPRAATAASQVLQGFNPLAFQNDLRSRLVGVTFDGTTANSAEGRVSLDLVVNLLARLYPRVAIVPADKGAQKLADTLSRLACEINPDIDVMSGVSDLDGCIIAGRKNVVHARVPIYIGSDGWVARLSTVRPLGSGTTGNPFGAAAAACFGAANVFRAVFAQQLPGSGVDKGFSLSLLDLSPTARKPQNPSLSSVDIGESHLLGIGAIGNAAVWALAQVPDLRGTLHLVDDEAVDLGNLQRYVLATQQSLDTPKVRLAARWLETTKLRVLPHEKTWADHLRGRHDWCLERVAVALDSAQDRIAVQAALPRWIVNAWTQTGDLGVSRHSFLGEDACLACLYLPDGKAPDLSQIVADAIGLPTEKREVGRYLHTNVPLERAFLVRIADAKALPLERLLPFEGKSLRTFYSNAVCGGAMFQFNHRDGQAVRAEVPMAFQSAMAGILLASELVVHAASLRRVVPVTTTTMNLLRPLGQYLSHPRKKDREGRCICQDADYIATYRQKYLDSGPGGAGQ